MGLLRWLDNLVNGEPPRDSPLLDLCEGYVPHRDDIVSKDILPSPYEQMDSRSRRDLSVNQKDFTKRIVMVVRCSVCNRIKILTVDSQTLDEGDYE